MRAVKTTSAKDAERRKSRGGRGGKQCITDGEMLTEGRELLKSIVYAKTFKKAQMILTTVVSFYKPRLHGPSASTTDLSKTAEKMMRQQYKT